MTSGPRILISHASEKAELAARFNAVLEQDGYDTYLAPRDVKGSEDWRVRLQDEIQSEETVLLALVTETYFDREKLSATEFRIFADLDRDGRRGKICVVLLGDVAIPRIYSGFNMIRMVEDNIEKDYVSFLSHLNACLDLRAKSRRIESYYTSHDSRVRYEAHLAREYADILERLENPVNFPLSRARLALYGWQSIQGLSDKEADPLIVFYLIRAKLWDIRESIFTRSSQDLRRDLATARFYLFCMAAVAGINFESMKEVIAGHSDAFQQNNFQGSGYDAGLIFKYHQDMETLLAEIKDNDFCLTPEIIKKALFAAANLASRNGLSRDDMLGEETSEHRKEKRIISAQETYRHNRVTHVVRIYFEDAERNYFRILTQLSFININLIKTVSETLVPDRLARCTLWVYHSAIDLRLSLQSLFNENRHVKSAILGWEVERLTILNEDI